MVQIGTNIYSSIMEMLRKYRVGASGGWKCKINKHKQEFYLILIFYTYTLHKVWDKHLCEIIKTAFTDFFATHHTKHKYKHKQQYYNTLEVVQTEGLDTIAVSSLPEEEKVYI